MECLQKWLGPGIPKQGNMLVFLPAKEGGLGFHATSARAEAAFLASWEAVVDTLRTELDAPTEPVLREHLPWLGARVKQAADPLRARGAVLGTRSHGTGPGRQKHLTRANTLLVLGGRDCGRKSNVWSTVAVARAGPPCSGTRDNRLPAWLTTSIVLPSDAGFLCPTPKVWRTALVVTSPRPASDASAR